MFEQLIVGILTDYKYCEILSKMVYNESNIFTGW